MYIRFMLKYLSKMDYYHSQISMDNEISNSCKNYVHWTETSEAIIFVLTYQR